MLQNHSLSVPERWSCPPGAPDTSLGKAKHIRMQHIAGQADDRADETRQWAGGHSGLRRAQAPAPPCPAPKFLAFAFEESRPSRQKFSISHRHQLTLCRTDSPRPAIATRHVQQDALRSRYRRCHLRYSGSHPTACAEQCSMVDLLTRDAWQGLGRASLPRRLAWSVPRDSILSPASTRSV